MTDLEAAATRLAAAARRKGVILQRPVARCRSLRAHQLQVAEAQFQQEGGRAS